VDRARLVPREVGDDETEHDRRPTLVPASPRPARSPGDRAARRNGAPRRCPSTGP
jgi:hypothetical protein